MSSLVLGAVGATVGFFTGGPAGAFYGFGIGYGLGSLKDARRAQGAQVGDLRVTGSAYGEPIPWVRGAPRVSGQIVWASQKRATPINSSGKGGGSVTTGYSYKVDVLYKLAEGTNVRTIARIFSNGELVWTRRTGASDASLAASDGTDQWDRLAFYDGNAAQMPDPTYEAGVGAGNAPAHRGSATLMVQGLSCGTSGQLPNLTFELVTGAAPGIGTATTAVIYTPPTPIVGVSYGTPASASTTFQVPVATYAASPSSVSVTVQEVDAITGTVTQVGAYTIASGAYTGTATGTSDVCCWVAGSLTTAALMASGTAGAQVTFTLPESLGITQLRFGRSGSAIVFGSSNVGAKSLHRFSTSGGSVVVSSSPLADFVNSILIVGSTVYAASKNTQKVYVLDLATLTLQTTLTHPAPGSDIWPVLFLFDEQMAVIAGTITSGTYRVHQYVAGSWVARGDIVGTSYHATSELRPTVSVVGGLLFGGLQNIANNNQYLVWTAPITVDPAADNLRDLVAAACARAGMPAGSYDVTAVPTTPVRSLAVTRSNTRALFEQLAAAYFLTCWVRDKVYFGVRGTAAAATIPWEDLAAGPDSRADQPLALQVGNDLELPPQATVTYINVSNDAQTGTETSDRITSGQAAVRSVTLGIGMTPAEAKRVADAMVADAAAALVTAPVALPMPYAKLDPSDVVDVVDRDGRVYRLRLERKRSERGVLSFEAVGDDASVIVSAQVTDGTQTPSGEVSSPSATLLYALDAPLLRDVDDGPGFLVATRGTTATWPGSVVLASPDGVTYATAATVDESAVMGTCTTTLGTFTGVGMDEMNSVTVNVAHGTLSSVTRDALLADEAVNAMLIGAEVVRFATATLSSADPNVYVLTRLLRGQRGTESAISGHSAGERCTLLRTRGLRPVTQQQSAVGRQISLKGVTVSANPANVAAVTFTNSGVSQKPLAPTSIRGTAIAGQDLQLTWLRRSRLSSRFLAPSGVPLGEAAEAYVCRVYVGSTLKRSFTPTAPSAIYTRAQQVADGLTTPITLRVDVTQISAAVGEGYVGTGATTSTATTQAQVSTLTLGGTFAAGLVLRVQLASTLVSYTTLAGDTNLAGVATALAAAIDATADYAATAVGQVVTVTGPVSAPYVVSATVVPGDNTITLVQTQAAAPADPLGGRYQAAITYTNSGVPLITSGTNIELVPAGVTFGVQVERPAGTVLGVASYTTPAAQFAFQVHAGLTSALQAVSALNGPGYGAGVSYLTGVERYLVWGPYGVTGVTMSTFATAPYGMSLTVEATGSLPTPTAVPQIITATLAGTTTAGYVYRLTLGGVAYSYTASGGDTMTVVAAALASAIDAAAEYVATSSGAVVTVTGATANVPFLFSADIQGGATTIAAAITQEAT